jgi:hypothetical protein
MLFDALALAMVGSTEAGSNQDSSMNTSGKARTDNASQLGGVIC